MDLKKLREDIDAIDTLISSLIEKRMELVEQIAKIKKENNLPKEDLKREEEIINRLTLEHKKVEKEIKELYKVIFDLSKKRE